MTDTAASRAQQNAAGPIVACVIWPLRLYRQRTQVCRGFERMASNGNVEVSSAERFMAGSGEMSNASSYKSARPGIGMSR